MGESHSPRVASVVAIVAVVILAAALAIPPLFSSRRLDDSRSVEKAFQTLVGAEVDFRTNDRDGNGVQDYWTGDVKGLYTMTSAAVPGAVGARPEDSLRLIPLQMAQADADGTMVPAGGENVPLSNFVSPQQPYRGYWFAALLTEDNWGASKEATYRQDTGGKPLMGSCHHLDRFGFAAVPDSTSAGKYVYIVSENDTVWRAATTGRTRLKEATPPGLDGIESTWLRWPSDLNLKSYWSHRHDER